MTALQTIKPDALTIGGAQFYDGDRTLYAVRAETGEASAPIALHVVSGSHRSMVDLTIEDAELLASALALAVRLRRDAAKH